MPSKTDTWNPITTALTLLGEAKVDSPLVDAGQITITAWGSGLRTEVDESFLHRNEVEAEVGVKGEDE